ncbi:MAG: hypothetical protein ACJ72N_25275 [Labedaea sp.]
MTHDFDFLHGDWDVHNRRLTKRLVGSDDWDEFPGSTRCHGFFGGAGNFDEIAFPTKGFSGATIRMFNAETGQWAIYWVNSRRSTLDPGVFGGFVDGVGTFYGDDTDDGTPVRVRYLWSEITPASARWEQAFSVDGEQTWETNWIMALTRR